MCQGRGGGRPFLCPEGTRFNQRTFVCDHAYRVKCSEASNFFHRNVIVHEESVKSTPRSGNSNLRGSKLHWNVDIVMAVLDISSLPLCLPLSLSHFLSLYFLSHFLFLLTLPPVCLSFPFSLLFFTITLLPISEFVCIFEQYLFRSVFFLHKPQYYIEFQFICRYVAFIKLF
jgi:hypothetical protein